MRQEINNSPANSGNGDTLKESFDKVNAMTTELYDNVDTLFTSIGAFPTLVSELTNDAGYITIGDVPSTWEIADIIDLQTTLTSMQADTTNTVNDIADLQDASIANSNDITDINSALAAMLQTINTQNGLITQINADILSIKQRLNALEA
jgi:hypothetical protein